MNDEKRKNRRICRQAEKERGFSTGSPKPECWKGGIDAEMGGLFVDVELSAQEEALSPESYLRAIGKKRGRERKRIKKARQEPKPLIPHFRGAT